MLRALRCDRVERLIELARRHVSRADLAPVRKKDGRRAADAEALRELVAELAAADVEGFLASFYRSQQG